MAYKKTTTKKRFVKSKSKSRFSRPKLSLPLQIARITQSQKEPKRKLINSAMATLNSAYYTLNVLGNISKGDTAFDRETDDIQLCSLKGKYGVYNNASINSTTHVRVMLCRSKIEGQSASDSWTSSTLGTANMALNSIAASPITLSLYDPKLVTILYDKTHQLVPQFSNQTVFKEYDFNIPLNVSYKYKNGSNYGSKYNLYWCVVTEAPTANTITVSSYVHMSHQLIFKDN